MPKGKVSDINSLTKTCQPQESHRTRHNSPKLFKMSSNLIDSHFRNVINYDTEDKSFPDSAKIVSPRPIY